MPVTFFARKGADCLGKFHGEAERTLRLLFEEVRTASVLLVCVCMCAVESVHGKPRLCKRGKRRALRLLLEEVGPVVLDAGCCGPEDSPADELDALLS